MTELTVQYACGSRPQAVRLVAASPKSASQSEPELDIGETYLSRWSKQLAADGDDAFAGQGRLTLDWEGLRQPERENEILRQERDNLEEAVAILSLPGKCVYSLRRTNGASSP